jgi:hypothetical protein
LRTVFKGQIPSTFTEIDPKQNLETQICMNVKKNNLKIAKAMTLQDIRHTDLYEFLEKVELKLRQ